MADELNTELAGVIAQAGMIDGQADANSPEAIMQAQELEAAVTMADQNTAAVAGMFELALPIICPMYPSLETIYTPEVRAQIAVVMGPLLAKYGINMHEMGGRYREELAAAFVCGPIAVATYKGIKADIEARTGAPKAIVHAAASNPAAPNAQGLMPGDYGYTEPGA